ncbi:MAG TPA: DUF779 domain-containing protein [Solirubrobacteraceae bacterium]
MLSTRTPLTATPGATAMLKRLSRKNGPLAIFQSGGCCDGSLPLCLLASEMAPSPNDVRLGHAAGVPFYIDREQYERWGEPEFLLDVAAGAPEGFSLGERGAHFVSAPRAGGACQAAAA